jgi:hypothetical protein
MNWSRLSEQTRRVDKWSPAGVRMPSGAAALHELEIVPSGGKRKQELGMFGLKRPTRIDLRSNDAAIVVRENGEMELFIRQAKGDEELPPSQVVLALFGMAFHDERVRKLLAQIVKEKQN